MNIFKNFKPLEAPLKWEFTDPDTGFVHAGTSKQDLFTKIKEYRHQNKLDVLENLSLVIEHNLCLKPENSAKCRDFKLNRGFMGFWKGGIAVIENLFFGEKNMVSQEKADARSLVCAECPYNIFPDKTFFPSWSDMVAENSTGGKKSIMHNSLGNCEVCTCTLKAKVFHKEDLSGLSLEELQKMKSVGCWVITEEQERVREKGGNGQ